MTPQERAGIPSDVIHPQSKIEEGLAHLDKAYHEYATPQFDALPTYRHLARFYREYLESGCMQRCRPLRQNVVYLSLILAAARGDNANRILDLASPIINADGGEDVRGNVDAVIAYTMSHGSLELS